MLGSNERWLGQGCRVFTGGNAIKPGADGNAEGGDERWAAQQQQQWSGRGSFACTLGGPLGDVARVRSASRPS